VPELLVLSKTLGGGVPISALITSPAIEQKCQLRGFTRARDPSTSSVRAAPPDFSRAGVSSVSLPSSFVPEDPDRAACVIEIEGFELD